MYACISRYLSDEVSAEVASLLLKHSQIEIFNKFSKDGQQLILINWFGRIKCVRVLADVFRVDINMNQL